jgi:hypothetical protein
VVSHALGLAALQVPGGVAGARVHEANRHPISNSLDRKGKVAVVRDDDHGISG